MNMPLERSPGSDPAGGMVEPPRQPTHAVTLVSTADRDRSTRSTLTGDSLHTVSAIYPSRAEADGVRVHLIEREIGRAHV